jgi:hypothetical protein
VDKTTIVRKTRKKRMQGGEGWISDNKNYKEYAEFLVEYVDARITAVLQERKKNTIVGQISKASGWKFNTESEIKNAKIKIFWVWLHAVDAVLEKPNEFTWTQRITDFQQNNLPKYLDAIKEEVREIPRDLNPNEVHMLLLVLQEAIDFANKDRDITDKRLDAWKDQIKRLKQLSRLRFHFGKPTFLIFLHNAIVDKLKGWGDKDPSLQYKETKTISKKAKTVKNVESTSVAPAPMPMPVEPAPPMPIRTDEDSRNKAQRDAAELTQFLHRSLNDVYRDNGLSQSEVIRLLQDYIQNTPQNKPTLLQKRFPKIINMPAFQTFVRPYLVKDRQTERLESALESLHRQKLFDERHWRG